MSREVEKEPLAQTTAIKICGLNTREHISHVNALPADYIGFVFAKSKRQVTAEQVADLTRDLPLTTKLVGVFVNEEPDEILRIAQVAGLDVLQLHGDETPATCRELRERSGLQVWKAWSVHQDERDARLTEYGEVVDAILLDNARGGTGQKFSWDAIPTLRDYIGDLPLFVAGGLDPVNVGDLLAAHRPFGVDVSSGVETEGAKDAAKITAFVQKVRASQ
ncbi:MAG TPA: phosphoribosylanthranilate isomerase [Bacilli bacterium]|nr:phosphoribosylanthranilate isomerase [Bacilli bacterium]